MLNNIMKTCKICKEEKPLVDFGIHKGQPDGYNVYCKMCLRKKHITPEAKVKARARSLKATYNISVDEYNHLLESQGNVCAICKKINSSRKPLSVDHCHSDSTQSRGTKDKQKIRGLLCEHCNHGLGKFFDDTGLLQNAIEYLKKHRLL
jgi:hypothetical protein